MVLNKLLCKSTFANDSDNPDYDTSDVVCLGISFDLTSGYGKGSWFGPAAIFEASWQLENTVPIYNIPFTEKVKIHNLGIFEYPKSVADGQLVNFSEIEITKHTEQMVCDGKEISTKVLKDNKFLVILGGEHSIINGPMAALSEIYNPEEVTIVQFDAHLDLRDKHIGGAYSHASVMARVKELGFNIVQVGIRDHISKEEVGKINDSVFFCATQPEDFYANKDAFIFNGELTDEQIANIISKVNTKHVWFTIDLDVLDPKEMLATGTPLPFGLSLKSLHRIIYALIKSAKEKRINFLGFDVTELQPMLINKGAECYRTQDCITNAPEILTAQLIYNILFWQNVEKFK